MALFLQTFHDESSLTVALVEVDAMDQTSSPKRVILVATFFTKVQADVITKILKPALDDEAATILDEQITAHEWDPNFADANTIMITEKSALWYFLFVRDAHARFTEDGSEDEDKDDDGDEDGGRTNSLPLPASRRPPKTPGLQ